MPNSDSTLGRQHGFTAPTSRALGAADNMVHTGWDANLFRPADHYVYLYTVSDREFTISQPPLFPRFILPARKPGERVSMIAKIPSPFLQIDREGAVGDLIVRAHVGECVAQSICNPNNYTLDQDAVTPDATITGLGVDLNAQGIFWSTNDPEHLTEVEIKKAEKRRERYYNALLERARTLEIANPKELEGLINQDYHMAAEYYGVETTWHKKLVKFAECPNCGENIKTDIAYHRNSSGIICIIDTARAAKAGVTAKTISTAVSS